MIKRWMLSGSVLLLAAAAPAAMAQTYAFDCVTFSNAGNCASGASQLTVTVSGPAANQALFTFVNAGPAASSITDIYFDDGTLLALASVIDGVGVDFAQGASPGNLPGGNPIGFNTTAGFSADSEPPTQPNGVNPGETVAILFTLQAGRSFADVNADLASGALRIGLHVQGFGNGGSESFVNEVSPVPEPTSWLMMVGGLAALRALRRKRLARR